MTTNYYEAALERHYDYQEMCERSELQRDQIAAGTHVYDEATGTVIEKPDPFKGFDDPLAVERLDKRRSEESLVVTILGCCQQCDEHDAHDPDELLRCELCGIELEAEDGEPIEVDGGGELMACHKCVERAEGAKAEAAAEEYQNWLDDQITPTDYERLGKGGR